MKIIESGLESLRAMHTHGSMVHGNINPETVVILAGEEGATGLKDLQDAAVITPEPRHAYAPSEEAVDCFSRGPDSPPSSARDDVLRLLMVGGYMINGPAWMALCRGLEATPSEMRAFKYESNFFLVPELPDPLAGVEEERKVKIARKLQRALEIARVHGEIDYEGIFNALNKAEQLADGSRTGCIIA